MTAPAGFQGAYERAAREPAEPGVLSDLLALVGYEATAAAVASWSLERRVQAEVHAVNVHLRASDNRPMRAHPRPDWMPPPWGGPTQGEGIFEMPVGTTL